MLPPLVIHSTTIFAGENVGLRTGTLDASKVLELSGKIGNKLSAVELREAMEIMDGGDNDEVDFRKFYAWWTREDKPVSTRRAEEYYTIVPH